MIFNSDIKSLIYSMDIIQRIQFKKLIENFKEEGLDKKLKYSKFKCDDIINSINSINTSEKEKYKAEEASLKGETTIDVSKWGVHERHCCLDNGCKYGDIDCPVVLNLVI